MKFIKQSDPIRTITLCEKQTEKDTKHHLNINNYTPHNLCVKTALFMEKTPTPNNQIVVTNFFL